LAEKRKSKQVKLNQMSSISSGGGGGQKMAAENSMDERACYNCGQTGHEQRHCPQQRKRKYEDSGGSKLKKSRIPLEY